LPPPPPPSPNESAPVPFFEKSDAAPAMSIDTPVNAVAAVVSVDAVYPAETETSDPLMSPKGVVVAEVVVEVVGGVVVESAATVPRKTTALRLVEISTR